MGVHRHPQPGLAGKQALDLPHFLSRGLWGGEGISEWVGLGIYRQSRDPGPWGGGGAGRSPYGWRFSPGCWLWWEGGSRSLHFFISLSPLWGIETSWAKTEMGVGGSLHQKGFLRIIFISVSPTVIYSGSEFSGNPSTWMLSVVF